MTNKFQQQLKETIGWLIDYAALDHVIQLNNIREMEQNYKRLESLISRAVDCETTDNAEFDDDYE